MEKLAACVLMFGTTYTCESFSQMSAIKTDHHTSLINEGPVTSYDPNIPGLSQSMNCNFSYYRSIKMSFITKTRHTYVYTLKASNLSF